MATIAANWEGVRRMNSGVAARAAGPAERLMAPWEFHQAKTEQAAIWQLGDLFDIDP